MARPRQAGARNARTKARRNVGAYERPFSGVGMEFAPLGSEPDEARVVLHETGYLPANAKWKFPGVYGSYWRLYHNLKPGHHVHMHGRRFELGPGRIVLIPGHQLFQCEGSEPVPHFWMHFSAVRRLAPGHAVPVCLRPTRIERALIAELIRHVEAPRSERSRETVQAFGSALLDLVLCRPELDWQVDFPAPIVRAEAFMKEHIAEKITIAAIARAAGVSEAGLDRLFHRHLHTTPGRHLRQLRVGHASRLLLQTPLSIEEIAPACGMADRNYLSRVFHAFTGEWPATFRRKHGKMMDEDVPTTGT